MILHVYSIIPLPRYAPTLVDNGRESQIFIPRLCLIFPLTVNCHRTSVFNNDSPKKTTVQNDRLTGLWNRVAMYMYNRFYTIRQCDGQTDGQADIYKYRTSDKYTREKLWGMNGIGTHRYMKFPPQTLAKTILWFIPLTNTRLRDVTRMPGSIQQP